MLKKNLLPKSFRKTLKVITTAVLLVLSIFTKSDASSLSGTYTIPGTVGGTTVNNLTDLAGVLSSLATTINGTVVFEFTSGYTGEPNYPVTFTAFAGGGKVIVRPAASVSSTLTTAGSPASLALIYLNGITNITFDGRPGGAGNTIEWQFQNTANGGSYPTFLYVNGAAHDTLQYLNIQASGTSSSSTINFGTSGTAPGGCSNNLIQYCNIAPYSASPYTVIYSSGTAGANANANNTILNNNIYNFQGYSNGPPTNGGIVITSTGNGNGWNITGNSFYSSVTTSQYTSFLTAIYFGAGTNSNGNTISGNYIGGKAPQCGTAGAPWIFGGYRGYTSFTDFTGIYVSAGTTTPTVVSNNTIQNIRLNGLTSQTFSGINVTGGNVTVSGNTVGSASTANSIEEGGEGVVVGIWDESSGSVTISGNTVANLISDFAYPPSGWTYADVIGIYVYSSSLIGPATIVNNNVFNLTTTVNDNFNQYFPINGGGGTSTNSTVWEDGMLAGIYLQSSNSGTQTISKNTVHDLSITTSGGTNSAYIYGISISTGAGSTNIINGNSVYGLWSPANFGSSGTYYTGLVGIYIWPSYSSGTYKVTNNMVALGYRPTDGSSQVNSLIYGIWDNGSSFNVNCKVRFYHNSVYIGGSDNTKLNSYAFASAHSSSSTPNSDSLTVKNNIFVNNRTSTGAGKHYGLYLSATSTGNPATVDEASDYNLIYGTGASFKFASLSGTDYATQALWNTAFPGFDAHSLSSDPLFVSPTGLVPDLHVQTSSPVDAAGTAVLSLVYDYDSLLRANYSPVDIGAVVIGNCGTPLVPSVTISSNPGNSVCSSTSVTFTATPTNGGTSPSYQWKKNGNNVGSNSVTYTDNGLANGDVITVMLTSNAPCASPTTGTSTGITMTVTASVTPSVSITTPQTTICSGTSATFTATPANGGNTPAYQWKKNGNVVGSNSITYTDNALANNDIITCVVTSNAQCASPVTATSNTVTMKVNPTVVPAVSITPSQNNICAGTSVTFTATPTNGGTSPSYQWKKNGNVVGSNSTTYTDNTLANNDVITCVLTSNAQCVSPVTATSNTVTMVVNAPVTPAVSISGSQNNICSGTAVTFTAAPTNGGADPSYQWKKNGSIVGSSSSTYTDNSLANNDIINCVITSNAACASPATATSNNITMVVIASVVPTVTISTTQDTICDGASASFAATTTGGGTNPAYQWKVNSTNGGTNSSTFTDAGLHNSDAVTCVITSNAQCASPASVTSNVVTMTVNPVVTPSVTISANPGNVVNAGTSVTFTASVTNGGSSPVYVWLKNGAFAGATSSTYTSGSLMNGDVITCTVISNAACASTDTATSSGIIMTIETGVSFINNKDVSIKLSPNPVYQMATLQITNPVGSSYAWEVENMVGQKVLDGELKVGSGLNATELDLSSLTAGMYVINVKDFGSDKIYRLKIVKVKL